MFRPLAVGSALVLLLAVAPAAPIPKEKSQAPDYYPTALGSKWVYKFEDSTDTTEITAVETRGDARIVTFSTPSGAKDVTTYTVSVSRKGVFRTHLDKEAIDPTVCFLQHPYKPGDTWDVDTVIRGLPAKLSFTAREAESVEVPAGRYRAVRVDADETFPGKQSRLTYWFAPDVGLVKIRYTTGESDAVTELQSFTPGKKD